VQKQTKKTGVKNTISKKQPLMRSKPMVGRTGAAEEFVEDIMKAYNIKVAISPSNTPTMLAAVEKVVEGAELEMVQGSASKKTKMSEPRGAAGGGKGLLKGGHTVKQAEEIHADEVKEARNAKRRPEDAENRKASKDKKEADSKKDADSMEVQSSSAESSFAESSDSESGESDSSAKSGDVSDEL